MGAGRSSSGARSFSKTVCGETSTEALNAIIRWALVQTATGEVDEASDALEESLDTCLDEFESDDPSLQRVMVELGTCRAAAGDYEGGEEILGTVLEDLEEKSPQRTRALLGLAQIYRMTGRLEEAERCQKMLGAGTGASEGGS